MANRKGNMAMTVLVFMEGDQFEHTDMLRPEQRAQLSEAVLNAIVGAHDTDNLPFDHSGTAITEVHILSDGGRRIHRFGASGDPEYSELICSPQLRAMATKRQADVLYERGLVSRDPVQGVYWLVGDTTWDQVEQALQ